MGSFRENYWQLKDHMVDVVSHQIRHRITSARACRINYALCGPSYPLLLAEVR